MEISELQTIIEKSGLSNYRIEKDLKIPNGTLAQVLKGTKKLPEKYEAPLRGLVIMSGETPVSVEDIAAINSEPSITIEEVPEPEEVYTFSKEEGVITLEGKEKNLNDEQSFIEADKRMKETYGEGIKDFANVKTKQVKRPDMSIADLL